MAFFFHHTSLCAQLKQSLLIPAGSWKTIIKIFFPLSAHTSRAKADTQCDSCSSLPCACFTAPPVTDIVLYFTHPPLQLFYISPSLSCIYPSQKPLLALISKNSSMPFRECLPAFQGYSISLGTSAHPFLCLTWSCKNPPHRIRHTSLFNISPFTAFALHECQLCPSF